MLALATTGGCGLGRMGAEGCMPCDPSISLAACPLAAATQDGMFEAVRPHLASKFRAEAATTYSAVNVGSLMVDCRSCSM